MVRVGNLRIIVEISPGAGVKLRDLCLRVNRSLSPWPGKPRSVSKSQIISALVDYELRKADMGQSGFASFANMIMAALEEKEK